MAPAGIAGFASEGSFTPEEDLIAGGNDLTSISITLLSGQNLKRGSLLGKITSGGKYVLSLSASSDGSQTPAAILAVDCDASGGDKVTVAYLTGSFDGNAVTYGTAHTLASTREALRDVGINLQTSITG